VPFPVRAVRDVASATERTVKKIDAITKIIVVKTANDTEHTVQFLDRTVSTTPSCHRASKQPGSLERHEAHLWGGSNRVEFFWNLLKLGEESLIKSIRESVCQDI